MVDIKLAGSVSSSRSLSDVQSHRVSEERVQALTAIEYGLIAAGISVVIIATVNAIGVTLNAKFESVSTQLK